VLADSGLAAAVHALAETGSIPVTIGAMPTRRFEPAVESAAYFVAAELLRAPAASRAAVSAQSDDHELSLLVSTDATTIDLVRLQDRVGAGGGTIRRKRVEDGRLELEARIPCGS
jgi:hypothetical protein